MSQLLYTVVPDASFAAILAIDGPTGTNKIEGYVSMGGNTYYITENTSLPGGAIYGMMRMPNGSFIANRTWIGGTVVHTFAGWAIPA